MTITKSIFSCSCSCVEHKPKQLRPEVAFIGRSNVGKSSLINMLCGNKTLAKTSATPGKTLLLNYFLIDDSWYIVDLPGYGFAKISKEGQNKLKKMIQDYIGKSRELTMLFILIDSRHPLQEIDRNFITAVSDAEIPFSIVYTKSDKMSSSALKKVCGDNSETIRQINPETRFFITSSEKGRGKEEILAFLDEIVKNK